MKLKMEVNKEVVDRVVPCPNGNKSYAVSVEGTCRKCPYITEIKEKSQKEGIPAKVHCEPPIKHHIPIVELKRIDWDTMREMKEEV